MMTEKVITIATADEQIKQLYQTALKTFAVIIDQKIKGSGIFVM